MRSPCPFFYEISKTLRIEVIPLIFCQLVYQNPE